jgi:hypothetical protein
MLRLKPPPRPPKERPGSERFAQSDPVQPVKKPK